jgi:hypothetical protein
MRVLTITELMRLTRIELCNLARRITAELATMPEDAPERAIALISLRNIRYVLTRRDYSPDERGKRCTKPAPSLPAFARWASGQCPIR